MADMYGCIMSIKTRMTRFFEKFSPNDLMDQVVDEDAEDLSNVDETDNLPSNRQVLHLTDRQAELWTEKSAISFDITLTLLLIFLFYSVTHYFFTALPFAIHVTGIRRLATYSIGAAPAKALGFHLSVRIGVIPRERYRRLISSYSYISVFIGTAWVGRHGTIYHLLMSGRIIPRHAFALLFHVFTLQGVGQGSVGLRSRYQRCYSFRAGLQEGDDNKERYEPTRRITGTSGWLAWVWLDALFVCRKVRL
jgi:hypothetical protein